MPIFRTKKVSDYAVIAKHHLKNRALSYKAKGLLTFMLSVPPEWDWSMAGLSTLASDGIDGVRSGIRELEKHGYLTRRRIRDANGRLGDIEYTIHEIPQTLPGNELDKLQKKTAPNSNSSNAEHSARKEPILENPTLASPAYGKPILDFPTLDKPAQVLPTQENPTQYNNKVLSINELSTNKINYPCSSTTADSSEPQQLSSDTDTLTQNQQAECLTVKTAQGTGKPVDHTMTLVDEQFELFWQMYPRKVGKKSARKVWMNIRPDATLYSCIMAAISTSNQYWTHQKVSINHIPYPSTWLSEERWSDEFLPEQLASHVGLSTIETKTDSNQATSIGANYTIGGEGDPYHTIMQN